MYLIDIIKVGSLQYRAWRELQVLPTAAWRMLSMKWKVKELLWPNNESSNCCGCACMWMRLPTSRSWFMFIVLCGRCRCQGWTVHLQAVDETKRVVAQQVVWVFKYQWSSISVRSEHHRSLYHFLVHEPCWCMAQRRAWLAWRGRGQRG